MAYSTDDFDTLLEKDVVINEVSTIKLKLDRNKRNKNLKMHLREYKTSLEYTGFTKNGLTVPIENKEQLSNLKNTLDSFIAEVAKNL